MTVDPSAAGPSSLNRADRLDLLALLVVSLGVRLAYLLVKPASAVSLDLLTWRQAIGAIRAGQNPYLDGSFNWPPPIPQLLAALCLGFEQVNLSFDAAFWLILVAIECVLILVTFRLLRQSVSGSQARNILLVAIALNPAAAVQVTQHGNVHVLLMVWVMLAIGSIERFHERADGRDWLRACVWLGLGALTKVLPLSLGPLLAAGIGRISPIRRTVGAGLLIVPLAIFIAGVACVSPAGVWKHLVLYSSVHGYFGISGWLAFLDGVEFPFKGPLVRLHELVFVMGMVALSVGIAIRLGLAGWRARDQIALTAGLILLAIVTFGPGFGSQYIYWLIPPFALAWGRIPDRRWRRTLIIGWCVVAVTYTLDYLFNPGLGEALHEAFPHSDWIYRMRLYWARPIDQTLFRLPMFCVFVAILIEGVRVLRRISVRS